MEGKKGCNRVYLKEFAEIQGNKTPQEFNISR